MISLRPAREAMCDLAGTGPRVGESERVVELWPDP